MKCMLALLCVVALVGFFPMMVTAELLSPASAIVTVVVSTSPPVQSADPGWVDVGSRAALIRGEGVGYTRKPTIDLDTREETIGLWHGAHYVAGQGRAGR